MRQALEEMKSKGVVKTIAESTKVGLAKKLARVYEKTRFENCNKSTLLALLKEFDHKLFDRGVMKKMKDKVASTWPKNEILEALQEEVDGKWADSDSDDSDSD